MKRIVALALATGVAFGATAALAQEKVVVWWNKGFYEAEDKALLAAIDRWEKANPGKKIDLTLIPLNDMLTKTVSAIEAKNVPDIGFGWVYDLQSSAQWAANGILEDVSDVVLPLKDKFLPNVIPSVTMMNKRTGKASIYAMPIHMQTMHFHYWGDMLADAGFKDADIPRDWDGFWSFWCGKVQGALRAKGQRVYGIGWPASTAASDTYYTYYVVLGAYGVSMVDADGKLRVGDSATRDGMKKALEFYVKIQTDGCSPPGAISWTDADNNNNFHNRTTVATPNPSLSIPGKHLDDKNDDNYYNKVRTVVWPDGPGGRKLAYPVAVKQAVIFAESKNKAGAKSFMATLLQPENLKPYVEGSLGRWFPTMPELANTPFWTDAKDPHKSIAHRQYTTGQLAPFPTVANAAFSALQNENVFGKAIGRIIVDKWTSDRAIDEMIARIKELGS